MVHGKCLLAVCIWLVTAGYAMAIEECRGGDRAARHVNCVVDGDTLWIDGVKLRMLDIDAPETFQAECKRERMVGVQAKERLIQLMGQGYRIEYSGKADRTAAKRQLVRVRLKDGRDAGHVLLNESLAQRWPNKANPWCDY